MSLEHSAVSQALEDECGEIKNTRTVLATSTEFRTQLQQVVRSMERRLVISSTTLCSALYENPSFIDQLKRAVLTQRFTRVRILTGRACDAGESHALLALARSLPGMFQVRYAEEDLLQQDEFVVADERAVLYRINNERWNGMVELNNTGVARFYLERFDILWTIAEELTVEH